MSGNRIYYSVCQECEKEYIVTRRLEECPHCHSEKFLMNVGKPTKKGFKYVFKIYILGDKNHRCLREMDDGFKAKEYIKDTDILYIQINDVEITYNYINLRIKYNPKELSVDDIKSNLSNTLGDCPEPINYEFLTDNDYKHKYLTGQL